MKKNFKTPLYVKLLIATFFWGLVFGLLLLISNNPTYQTFLWGSGVVILLYNLLVLYMGRDRDDKIKTIKYRPQCSGFMVFPGGKECRGCPDCKGEHFINKNSYEHKDGEPWSV